MLAFDASGTPTAATLYAPYGGVRYSNGTMPTDYGFTGQHSDAGSTGLDYYGEIMRQPIVAELTPILTPAHCDQRTRTR